MISDTCDTIRDDSIAATSNKGIGSCFDDCIAVLATVVDGITTFDYYRSQGGAI